MNPLSDDEYADHISKLRSALNAVPSSQYTRHQFAGPVNGYTPERAAAHQQILDDAWAELGGDDIPKGKQGLILGGVPGSGKSTVREAAEVPGVGKVAGNFLPIDADYFKGKLIDAGLGPTLPGFSPMEAAPLMHQESNDLAKMLAKRAYQQGTNLAWDYTLRHSSSGPHRLAEFDRYGYTPHGIYVHTDPRTALARVTDRHREDLDAYLQGLHRHGGRYVPPEIITDSLYGGRVANRDNYDDIARHLATSQIFDNNAGLQRIGRRTAEFSSQPLNVSNDYSLAAFLQWCAHNHQKPDLTALSQFAALSGMDNENYLDIYLFMANSNGIFRDAAVRQAVIAPNLKRLYNVTDVMKHIGMDAKSLRGYIQRNQFPSPTHLSNSYVGYTDGNGGPSMLWDSLEPWEKWHAKYKQMREQIPLTDPHKKGWQPLPEDWAEEFKSEDEPKYIHSIKDLAREFGVGDSTVLSWYKRQNMSSKPPLPTHIGGTGSNHFWSNMDEMREWFKKYRKNVVPKEQGGNPDMSESHGQHDLLQLELPNTIDSKPVIDSGAQAKVVDPVTVTKAPPPKPQTLTCPHCFTQHAGECL